MIMSGQNGMDMNGSDASAAAGFNTTTPSCWTTATTHRATSTWPRAAAHRA
jgi:hypothetical protein